MIRCEGVTRTYGASNNGANGSPSAFTALHGVSFEIARGEFVAVMGPSGCGKSTLLHILGLLDRPTAGRYVLDGTDVSTMSDLERTLLRREKIGFVFQAFNLLPRLTTLENVCLPMAYAGIPRAEREARGMELLARVGLESKAVRTPVELSGGERQRVGIARALSNRPGILLADEPTGNLDTHSGSEILSVFKELNRDGLTVILVTHDPAIAAGARRALRLKDGLLAPD